MKFDFSLPLLQVSRWDGKEESVVRNEKKDVDDKRKRKHKEMDEEIDQGRVCFGNFSVYLIYFLKSI